MKTQISFFLILLSYCALKAFESHQTAASIPDNMPVNIMPISFNTATLCSQCSTHICEQCIEKSQIKQSMLSYTIEEQHRTITLQQKTVELQTQKINSLHSEIQAAAMQRETMVLQQDVLNSQLAHINALNHQLQLNQQEIEQLRDTVAEFRELLVPLRKENENRFNLMTKKSAALQELAKKKIPVQHALLATLAEMGREKKDAIWHQLGQPQHFMSKTLDQLSKETKETLKAWIS